MIKIEYVNFEKLQIPSWKCTYTLRPELIVIGSSLIEFGFIQPIHVRLSTGEIIDGSERLKLAASIEQIYEMCEGKIPVVYHDVDIVDAMMLHIRLNRGHSTIVNEKLSSIIKEIIVSRKYSDSEIRSYLSMGNDEFSVLSDGSLIKHRKIKEHNYAKAWVPIEAPSGKANSEMLIESPPNKDR